MDNMATVFDAGEDADRSWPSGLEREPPLGAHLTTSRRGYTHHGMYVGHDRVVHYSGLSGFRQCGPVEEVSLSRFAAGHSVQIVDRGRSMYSPYEIVRRARSRIGENDYRLLTNNCEHFCNWCLYGVSRSAQVERRWQLPFRVFLALFQT
jgi:Lecithin retinol acyltransferase